MQLDRATHHDGTDQIAVERLDGDGRREGPQRRLEALGPHGDGDRGRSGQEGARPRDEPLEEDQQRQRQRQRDAQDRQADEGEGGVVAVDEVPGATDIAAGGLYLFGALACSYRVLRQEQVTLETVLGALCVYLLLAYAFAARFSAIQTIAGDPFFAQVGGWRASRTSSTSA